MRSFRLSLFRQTTGKMGQRGGKISPATEFKPGQSGNPKGRPRKLPDLDKLLASVLGHEDEDKSEAKAILEALAKKAKKGDTRAAEILLDRGYGKAKQPMSTDGEITVTIKHG